MLRLELHEEQSRYMQAWRLERRGVATAVPK